ncbi:MAG: RNA methyltransferase [Candidatus Omnitrophica bacterium]|nr:RNA methyltransferase [Candidatus Omnitrophota bacterium]
MTLSDNRPSKNLVKRIRSLQSKKGRLEHGTFLAEGPNVVREVLRSDLALETLLVSESFARSPEAKPLLGGVRREAPFTLPDREFEKVSPSRTPQGILAEVWIPNPPTLPEAVEASHPIVILEEIQDPGNVGTAIRSAAALGAQRVVLTPGCADLWNPKTVRSSAGASFHAPLHPNRTIEQILEWLRSFEAVLWIASAEGESIHSLPPPRDPTALVFGNEARGPAPDWSDFPRARMVGLPMERGMDSLNVGVASAIFLALIREKAGQNPVR